METGKEFIVSAEGAGRVFRSGHETVHAVKDVDIGIRKGELSIFRGPSGSGKTTLLNLLGALDLPTSGRVFFLGKDTAELSETGRDELRRKHMGFVFQSIGLISIMSALENVEFGLRVSGCGESDRAGRAEECLHRVGMYKRRHHRPSELSGGEQQRVAISRAMAHGPDVIFADEPTSALDTMLGLQVVKLFKDLVETHNIAVVMTTHDPNLMEVADSVWTLRDGMLVDGNAEGGSAP